jgi:hypothetical protein
VALAQAVEAEMRMEAELRGLDVEKVMEVMDKAAAKVARFCAGSRTYLSPEIVVAYRDACSTWLAGYVANQLSEALGEGHVEISNQVTMPLLWRMIE